MRAYCPLHTLIHDAEEMDEESCPLCEEGTGIPAQPVAEFVSAPGVSE